MPDDNTPQNGEPNDAQNPGGETPQDFEAWLATQADDVKALYESHTSGLKTALKSERQRNADMATQLRDAAAKAEGETKAALEDMAGKAEAEAKRADFYEAAAGAGCTDLKLAFLAAQADDLFDRKGRPDIAAVKAAHPSLFSAPRVPDARAGRGAQGGNGHTGGAAIDDAIRRAAGKL